MFSSRIEIVIEQMLQQCTNALAVIAFSVYLTATVTFCGSQRLRGDEPLRHRCRSQANGRCEDSSWRSEEIIDHGSCDLMTVLVGVDRCLTETTDATAIASPTLLPTVFFLGRAAVLQNCLKVWPLVLSWRRLRGISNAAAGPSFVQSSIGLGTIRTRRS